MMIFLFLPPLPDASLCSDSPAKKDTTFISVSTKNSSFYLFLLTLHVSSCYFSFSFFFGFSLISQVPLLPSLFHVWTWLGATPRLRYSANITQKVNLHRQSEGTHAGSGMSRPWLDVYHLKSSQRWEHTGSSWQQQQQTQEQQSHHLQMLPRREVERRGKEES